MRSIKVALAGIGNLASALLQGVEYYRELSNDDPRAGIPHVNVGSYKVSSIEFVAAFDVDARKVGRDLSEAIMQPPNNTLKFSNVPKTGVVVKKGPVLDGLGNFAKDFIKLDDSKTVDVSEELKESGAEILINMTPGGSIKASEYYAKAALSSGCGFINATPSPIISRDEFRTSFRTKSIPLVGDDIQSQIGSTVILKDIIRLFVQRKVRIDETYVLDVGGDMESLNSIDRDRNKLKREIKRGSILSLMPYEAPVITGSSDFVSFMEDERRSYFWIKGTYFGGAPVRVDITVSTYDGPNGAAILLDVIRGVKIALDRGIGGALISVSAYGFKDPPIKVNPYRAEEWFHEFIEGKRCE
ncbi:MAG: inositol-3-phosphate synthase [Candidatus Asgardarchaeia archaeon]